MAKRTRKRAASSAVSLLRRAASSLANALTRRSSKPAQKSAASARTASADTPRRTKRHADVPLDRIENEYTPTQTILNSGFRASGEDRERDQEYGRGFSDDRWNDEDHYTNRSGDPRIGTHGRTYEPGEKRD